MSVPPEAPGRVATNGRELTDRCLAQSEAKRTSATAGAAAAIDPCHVIRDSYGPFRKRTLACWLSMPFRAFTNWPRRVRSE
jgi:hypothetical protein